MPAIADMDDLELASATDANLDAALTRLYALHLDAHEDDRAEVHAHIVAVIGEMSRRLDEWLAERA